MVNKLIINSFFQLNYNFFSFIGAIKVYEKEVNEEFIIEFNKKMNELNLNESLGKKDKEIEKKRLTKAFLEEINKIGKMKIYENFNFFEPLNNQFDFVVIKSVTIFEFTVCDEVRNIFNKDATDNEYAQLLTKKENVTQKEERKVEKEEYEDDISK